MVCQVGRQIYLSGASQPWSGWTLRYRLESCLTLDAAGCTPALSPLIWQTKTQLTLLKKKKKRRKIHHYCSSKFYHNKPGLTSYCFLCSRDLLIHFSLFLSDSCVHCLPRLSLMSLVVAWCQTKTINISIIAQLQFKRVHVVLLMLKHTSGRVLRKAFFSWLYHSCWGVLGFSGTFEPFLVILSTRSGWSSLYIHIINQHLSTIIILKYAAGACLISPVFIKRNYEH